MSGATESKLIGGGATSGGGGGGGSGNVTDINTDATPSQTLTTGTSGTDFAIVDNGSGDHKFNLPSASATARGLMTTGAQTVAGAKTFSSNPILSGGTANGVCYLDGSKNLTSGSSLTWDGTNLGVLLGLQLNHAATSAATSEIYNGVTDGVVLYEGGSGSSNSAIIALYGSTHATLASYHRFRVGTLVLGEKDASGRWALGTRTRDTGTWLTVGNSTSQTSLTGTTQVGVRSMFTANSSATAYNIAILGQAFTEDASFTNGFACMLYENALSKGSSSTVTRYAGIRLTATTAAGANAAIADNEAYSGNWFINQSGSVASTFGGAVTVTGIATLANATDASSSTVAGTVVTGGLAVAKAANIGTTLAVGTTSIFTGAVTVTGGIVGTTAAGNATAGNVGEYVESVISTDANVPAANGVWGDATSISLTAGDWDISALLLLAGPGGVTSAGDVAVGTASGTSTTGLVLGSNWNQFQYIAANGSRSPGVIPPYRVNISGTTTYYLKLRATYSATPTYTCRISARRIR